MTDNRPVPRTRIRLNVIAITSTLGLTIAGAAAYLDRGSTRTLHRSVPRAAGATTSTTGRSASTTALPSTSRSTTATTVAPRPITIAFGGDVHFEGVIRPQLDADPTNVLAPLAPMLQSADIAMVNLETAVTERGTNAAKEYTFRAPATAFAALRGAGIDVVTMANNHGVDYGPVGVSDSLDAARASSFPVVGLGANEDAAYQAWRTTVRGQRVSIIGATDVLDSNLQYSWTARGERPGLASAKGRERLIAEVKAERNVAETIVVYLHWGTELRTCPTGAQTTLARALVDAGADVIVGSHAHVLLGAGHLDNAYIAYGLGNFVFYSRGGRTAQSGVLTLTIAGRSTTAARWQPAIIQRGIARAIPPGPEAERATQAWNAARNCTGLAP